MTQCIRPRLKRDPITGMPSHFAFRKMRPPKIPALNQGKKPVQKLAVRKHALK